jgi:predicted nucleic acid-binding protein
MSAVRPLVLDASAVFNLGHRGQLLDVWEKLAAARQLIVTPEVTREVTLKPRADFDYRKQLGKLCTVWDAPLPHIGKIPPEYQSVLGPGELSVLGLAHEKQWEAVIDEAGGRAAAAVIGVRVKGTLGLLEMADQAGWLSLAECMEAVWRLKNAGFFLPVKPGANDEFPEYLVKVKQKVAGT